MPVARLDAFVPPPPSGRRAAVLARLTHGIVAVRAGRRVVVALDGVDGAGKTVLAHELAALVAPHREVPTAAATSEADRPVPSRSAWVISRRVSALIPFGSDPGWAGVRSTPSIRSTSSWATAPWVSSVRRRR